MSMIEFHDVNKYFGKFHALKNINLTVDRGEVVTIIGPSGSGKSTLLRCINGLERITSGQLIVNDFDLADKKTDSFPGELSGGQQQRVAIARSLAMKPKAILFDEPTSALDPEMIGDVLDVMQKIAEQGMTMVVVTHEMGFARHVGNRIVFMDDGQILVDSANVDQFFDDPQEPRAKEFISKIINH